MEDSMQSSTTVLLDPQNVGVTFGKSLLSCIEAEILRYFACTSGNGAMVAILNLPLTPMSESVHASSVVLADL